MTFTYLFITSQVALIAYSVGGLERIALYKKKKIELENSKKEAIYSVKRTQVSTLDKKEFSKNKQTNFKCYHITFYTSFGKLDRLLPRKFDLLYCI